MSDSPTTVADPTPSVSWRLRAARRTAGALGAAVVLAGIGPAIANAAGADVANPVAVALRASGKGLKAALSGDEAETVACETPTTEPSVEPTDLPTTDGSGDDAGESGEPTSAPSEVPSEVPSEMPSEEPSLDPDTPVSGEPSEAPSVAPVEEPAEDCAEEDDATPSPTASPTESETDESAEEGNHGQIVSTVAQCAPKGKDPLLDMEGAPANHGGYVRVAAHGDTLTLPWGSYDLSTQAGADDLCASLDAARESLAEEGAESTKGKKDKAGKGRQDKAKKAKNGNRGS